MSPARMDDYEMTIIPCAQKHKEGDVEILAYQDDGSGSCGIRSSHHPVCAQKHKERDVEILADQDDGFIYRYDCSTNRTRLTFDWSMLDPDP